MGDKASWIFLEYFHGCRFDLNLVDPYGEQWIAVSLGAQETYFVILQQWNTRLLVSIRAVTYSILNILGESDF